MTVNVGSTDRIVRAILGIGIIGVGYFYESWWGAIGIVPLFTAAIGWCPAYFPFGMTTCKTKLKK